MGHTCSLPAGIWIWLQFQKQRVVTEVGLGVLPGCCFWLGKPFPQGLLKAQTRRMAVCVVGAITVGIGRSLTGQEDLAESRNPKVTCWAVISPPPRGVSEAPGCLSLSPSFAVYLLVLAHTTYFPIVPYKEDSQQWWRWWYDLQWANICWAHSRITYIKHIVGAGAVSKYSGCFSSLDANFV